MADGVTDVPEGTLYGAFERFSPEFLLWIVARMADFSPDAVARLASTSRSWYALVMQGCAARLRALDLSRARPPLSLVPAGIGAPAAVRAYAALWPRTQVRREAMRVRALERQAATHHGAIPPAVAAALQGLRFVENSVAMCADQWNQAGGGRVAFELTLDGRANASALVVNPQQRRRYPAVEFDCEVSFGGGGGTHTVIFGYCLPGDSERRCFGLLEGYGNPFGRGGDGQVVRCLPCHPVLWDILADAWPALTRAEFMLLLRDCYEAAMDDLTRPLGTGDAPATRRRPPQQGDSDDSDGGDDDGDDDDGADGGGAPSAVGGRSVAANVGPEREGVGPYECRRAEDALRIPVFRDFFDVYGAWMGLRLLRAARELEAARGMLPAHAPPARDARRGIEFMGHPGDRTSALRTAIAGRRGGALAAYFREPQEPVGPQPIGSSFGYGALTPEGYDAVRPRPHYNRERLDAVRRGVLASPFGAAGCNPFVASGGRGARRRRPREDYASDSDGDGDGDDGDDYGGAMDVDSDPYGGYGYGRRVDALAGHRLGAAADADSERARLDRERQQHANERQMREREERRRRLAEAAEADARAAAVRGGASLTAQLHQARSQAPARTAPRGDSAVPQPVVPAANGMLAALAQERRMQPARRGEPATASPAGAQDARSGAQGGDGDVVPLTALLAAERLERRSQAPPQPRRPQQQQPRGPTLQFGGAQRLGYMDD